VAGERIPIEASSETVAFMLSAKTRVARASDRTFPVAPSLSGGQVLMGIPLTTPPGEYPVVISATSASGEERTAAVSVTVDALPTVPTNATTPPVVLLDGWQGASATSSCPIATDSTGTFGNLASYLTGSPNLAPVVYFFENCTECPNCSIEQLGTDLGTFLNSIQYSNGTPVPQFDVIVHSMGGLIVRSYLSGKQEASGAFSPPSVPKIRKAVFIATPHFGSFQADSPLAAALFAAGTQTNEMKRGSQFIWDLATWNQFADDLRGTDALAVIGNAGPLGNLSGASDGVVGLTSASLDFARPGRTRTVDYCHVSGSTAGGLAGILLGCTAPGIANIDSPSHQTYQIVSSFLADGTAWQTVGTAPAQDQYLSKYGGMVVADVNSSDQYVSPSNVSWGSVGLTVGAAGNLYYADMVSGTGAFGLGSSACGPYTQPAGIYSMVRCKLSPSVYSVGPLLSGTGRVVQTGTTIAITGAGFGAQQCGTCRVTASNPQSTVLQISSWSDTSIAALLPASFVGFAQIGVTTANGFDAIGIMAAPVSALAVAPSITAVSNSASFQGGFASATWVSIFGTDLSQTTRAWQSSDFVNGLLPTYLDGVSVTINGLAAYVEYISPGQINVLAPDDAASGAVQVQVTTAQGKSNSFTAQKAPFAPAFFTMGGSYVAALHADYTLVGKPGLVAGLTSTPAKPGETIQIYGTGFGPTNPPTPSAQPVATPAVLANSVQVAIGGQVASVTYAGLVGAGLYQINVTVPNVPDGDSAVLAKIGGAQTQTGVLTTIQQ
jgi:uncharacterized protein (TIGR03437 family)